MVINMKTDIDYRLQRLLKFPYLIQQTHQEESKRDSAIGRNLNAKNFNCHKTRKREKRLLKEISWDERGRMHTLFTSFFNISSLNYLSPVSPSIFHHSTYFQQHMVTDVLASFSQLSSAWSVSVVKERFLSPKLLL